MFSIILMYKYIDYYTHVINLVFSFVKTHNYFQYSFVTIHSLCFIIINATVVQVFFCERKSKRKITVKNLLTNKFNTIVK